MSNPATPAPPQQREMVFCHQCRMEWYRDTHGLVCPRCGGDFVEIIEERDDPHLNAPPMGMPDLIQGSDDEDDDEPFGLGGFFPPGVRAFSGGFGGAHPGHNHGTPGTPGGSAPPALPELLSALFGLMERTGGMGNGATSPGVGGDGARSPGAGGPPDSAGVGEAPQRPGAGAGAGSGWGRSPRTPIITQERTFRVSGPGGATISTRFTYDSSATLPGGGIPFPLGNDRPPNRRADSDPRVEHLPALLTRMFGPPPTGGAGGPPDPMMADILERIMGVVHPSGDYVFSQGDFDRLITELMEQHQGNAPPPAPKEVLDHLPKIKVTEEMVLNNEDCAVCKEDLEIDEELAQLPCKHHYHELCVRKWLESHDTCPICRRPTSDHSNSSASAGNATSSANPTATSNQNDTPSSASQSPRQQEQSIPGAWPSWFSRSSNSNDRGGT